jgi:hypothetical protein
MLKQYLRITDRMAFARLQVSDVWKTMVLLLSCASLAQAIDIAPELYENELKFPWGINFKYNGLLHHNLDRVWVVTKVPLPRWSDVKLPLGKAFNIDCEFPTEDIDKVAGAGEVPFEHVGVPALKQICTASKPLMTLLQQKEKRLKKAFISLMRDDLYAALPGLQSVQRHRRWIGPIVSLSIGVATLAIESLNTHLQRKRNEAMRKGIAALNRKSNNMHNFVKQFEKDFIMYGQYNMENLDDMIQAYNNLSGRQTELEKMIQGNNKQWPMYYLADSPGTTLYAHQLQLYIHTMVETHITMYDKMIASMESLMTAIAKLSKGYLPPELFTPSKMFNITQSVIQMVQRSHPGYTLALPSITQYYDMKLVTFSVDPSDHSLVVTFPVLIKDFHRKSLVLYEIETVPVPINDMNEQADSYSEVQISKPYIAVNNEYYIQLRMQELRMCKQIQYTYFCEELFLVKHKTKHSCASALFFDLPMRVIRDNCEFSYSFNRSVTPSVLDGGSSIVLANIVNRKKLICTQNFNLATPLPSHQYVLVNRSILCNCEIEAGMTYVLRSIGSCSDKDTETPMYFTINMAFFDYFREFMKDAPKHPKEPRLVDWKFPLHLHSTQLSGSPLQLKPPTNLKELLEKMKERQKFSSEEWDDIDSDDSIHLEKISSGTPAKIFIFVASILACLTLVGIIAIAFKYTKLRVLIAGLVLQKIPTTLAYAEQSTKPTDCIIMHQTPWLSYCIAGLTVLSLLYYLYKNFSLTTFCKGYKYDRYCTLYMYLTHNHFNVPIKILSTTGLPHLFRITQTLTSAQVTLRKNCMWDALHLDWGQAAVFTSDQKLSLPTDLTVPLWDKVRVRDIMSQEEFHPHFMIKQGLLWHHMNHPQLCEKCQERQTLSAVPVPAERTFVLKVHNSGTL